MGSSKATRFLPPGHGTGQALSIKVSPKTGFRAPSTTVRDHDVRPDEPKTSQSRKPAAAPSRSGRSIKSTERIESSSSLTSSDLESASRPTTNGSRNAKDSSKELQPPASKSRDRASRSSSYDSSSTSDASGALESRPAPGPRVVKANGTAKGSSAPPSRRSRSLSNSSSNSDSLSSSPPAQPSPPPGNRARVAGDQTTDEPTVIPYAPPAGFQPVSSAKLRLPHDHPLHPKNLAGKQLWHLSIPSHIPLGSIPQQISSNDLLREKPILTRTQDGRETRYYFKAESTHERKRRKLYVPGRSEDGRGYADCGADFTRSLSLQQIIKTQGEADPTDHSNRGPENVAIPIRKSIPKQPEGLRMRSGPMGTKPLSDEDEFDGLETGMHLDDLRARVSASAEVVQRDSAADRAKAEKMERRRKRERHQEGRDHGPDRDVRRASASPESPRAPREPARILDPASALTAIADPYGEPEESGKERHKRQKLGRALHRTEGEGTLPARASDGHPVGSAAVDGIKHHHARNDRPSVAADGTERHREQQQGSHKKRAVKGHSHPLSPLPPSPPPTRTSRPILPPSARPVKTAAPAGGVSPGHKVPIGSEDGQMTTSRAEGEKRRRSSGVDNGGRHEAEDRSTGETEEQRRARKLARQAERERRRSVR